MSPYIPQDTFTGPEIYDLSDLVKGGDAGDANVPLKALADQANFLNNRRGRWDDVMVIGGDHTWDNSDLHKLLVFQISENRSFSLPDAGSLLFGTRITVRTSIPAIKALTVQATQTIVDGSTSWVKWNDGSPGIYMHDAEKLVLVAAGDHWLVEDAKGNFDNYGQSFGDRKQRHNTIVGDGTLYNRVDVPRVTLYGLSLGQAIVSDGIWLSSTDPTPIYRGCYSSGNGSTTIRVPDERGLSDKYLDLGRGLDSSRIYPFAGGFEDEQVKKHDHTMHGKGGIFGAGVSWFLGFLNAGYSGGGSHLFGPKQGSPETNMRTGDSTDTQNAVKNIGKIPLIRL